MLRGNRYVLNALYLHLSALFTSLKMWEEFPSEIKSRAVMSLKLSEAVRSMALWLLLL